MDNEASAEGAARVQGQRFSAPRVVASLAAFCSYSVVALAQGQPSPPIIVKIIPPEQKSELSGLADVLLGSLGLTGLIVVAAVALGAVMAGVMFWVRSRS